MTACVEASVDLGVDEQAVHFLRHSLDVVAEIPVRTIAEGSTVVWNANSTNNAKAVSRVISCAPRGKRAQWT